jgi:hypothetical protein
VRPAGIPKRTEIKPTPGKGMPSRNQPWAWNEAEDERLKALVAEGA